MTMYLQALAKSGIIALGIMIAAVVVLLVVFVTMLAGRARKEKTVVEKRKDIAADTKERSENMQEQPVTEQEMPSERQEQIVAQKEEPSIGQENAASKSEHPVQEVAAAQEPAVDVTYPAFIRNVVDRLPQEQSAALESIVLQDSENLNARVKVPVSQYEDEKDFLADFFRSCSKYAKRLPIAVTENLYERQKPYADTERKQIALRRKMIGAYYVRRKEEDTLPRCENLCKEDVTYHLQAMGVENVSLPPLKKLVLLCVSQGRYDDALSYCDMAIKHHIIDRKGAGYEERKEKVALKKERAEEKQRKALQKLQAQKK